MNRQIFVKNIKLQSGLSLLVTLIMLSALMMMSVGFYLLVDSTNSVSNNIALKQASMHAAEKGIDDAAKWLNANQINLTADNMNAGYYASSPDIGVDSTSPLVVIDYTGFTTPNIATDDIIWSGGSTNLYSGFKLLAKVGGFDVFYIIHRLCSGAGAFSTSTAISCATSAASMGAAGSYSDGAEYGAYKITEKTRLVYRITARAVGPNNTSTFLQSKLLIEY